MADVSFVDFGGKKILLMDFSNIEDDSKLIALSDKAIDLVRSGQERHSVLAVLDITKTRVSKTVIAALKRLSQNNGPYIRSMTFVGFNAFWSLLFRGLLIVTKRSNHAVFHERTRALDWLANH